MKKIIFKKPFLGYKEGDEINIVLENLKYVDNKGNLSFIDKKDIQTMIDCGIVEEVGKWVPKDGETYFTFFETGKIMTFNWHNDSHDKSVKNEGFGIYKTEAEAQSMFDYIKKCVRERGE